MVQAEHYISHQNRETANVEPEDAQVSLPEWTAVILYKIDEFDNSLLDKEYLLGIQKFENQIRQMEDFQDFCLVKMGTNECDMKSTISSPLDVFNMLNIKDTNLQ